MSAESIDWDTVVEGAGLTDANIALIHAFRSHPGHAATASMLADDLGYEGYRAANLAIGTLGRRLGTTIAADFAPRHRPDGSAMWWTLVATGEDRDDGHYWWTLRSDLDNALRRCGI